MVKEFGEVPTLLLDKHAVDAMAEGGALTLRTLGVRNASGALYAQLEVQDSPGVNPAAGTLASMLSSARHPEIRE